MPELQEIIVPDGISAMYPMQSFAPTEERNTLLVWTAKGNLVRIVFSGENAEIIPERALAGVPDKGRILQIRDSIYWSDKQFSNGIVQYSKAGMKLISKDILNLTTDIYYLEKANVILAATVASYNYMYHIDTEVWTENTGTTFAGTYGGGTITVGSARYDIIVHRGNVINQNQVHRLYDTPPSISIITKKYSIESCMRFRVNGYFPSGALTASITIYGRKIWNGSRSITGIPIIANTPTGIPGLRNAEYIQISLSATYLTTGYYIKGIDIEVIE